MADKELIRLHQLKDAFSAGKFKDQEKKYADEIKKYESEKKQSQKKSETDT